MIPCLSVRLTFGLYQLSTISRSVVLPRMLWDVPRSISSSMSRVVVLPSGLGFRHADFGASEQHTSYLTKVCKPEWHGRVGAFQSEMT